MGVFFSLLALAALVSLRRIYELAKREGGRR